MLMGVLCVTVTAAGLFLGSAEGKSTDVLSMQQQESKIVALLGDLNEHAPDSVKNKLRQLINDAESRIAERESKGDYRITREEVKLWKAITDLLDKETIRQYGVYYYKNLGFTVGSGQQQMDYGMETMENLKKEISTQDWNSLNKIRNDYFAAEENGTQNSTVNAEFKMREILKNYRALDADAIILNTLSDKNQQTLGMFIITPEHEAVYQDGAENGLNRLEAEEQEALHQIWEETTAILPKEMFTNFKYFVVAGDGEYGVLAYVTKLGSENEVWSMAVDWADIKDDGFYPYTVVHEMAHYITLNDNQLKYDKGSGYPIDRYTEWMCVAKEDSYIQAYYNLFWRDIIIDWYVNPENPYFFFRHQSEFVSSYASTDCAEDMAESFAAYVLLEKASTPEAQAKLDFFDSYPELKAIKTDILNNIKENDVYVSPTIAMENTTEVKKEELDGFVNVLVGITEILCK
ncbi:hypothetical protein CLNEO_14740 [Anaerotignum neopropionicum]|uniref:Uncharacterized protein n=2 Tax=Anaerotignum neopropionicum TaxID=36847 RepID=A0A136WEI4_9FIRM|nr:hypothetical protein CLNEO_14740 [Anaerotignum neopropionicum]